MHLPCEVGKSRLPKLSEAVKLNKVVILCTPVTKPFGQKQILNSVTDEQKYNGAVEASKVKFIERQLRFPLIGDIKRLKSNSTKLKGTRFRQATI